MSHIKCDKILCVYNYTDYCLCSSIELANGMCLEYVELEPLEKNEDK